MGGFQTPLMILQTAMSLGRAGERNDAAEASANARIAALQRQQAQEEAARRGRLQQNLATRHAMAAASGVSSDGSGAAVADNLAEGTEEEIASGRENTGLQVAGLQSSLAAAQQRNLLQQSQLGVGAIGRLIRRRNLFSDLD